MTLIRSALATESASLTLLEQIRWPSTPFGLELIVMSSQGTSSGSKIGHISVVTVVPIMG